MKILVIDDDADLNRLLSLFLEKQGYEVASAGDALQALDTLDRDSAIGMVIVDLMMPHMDGIRFTETLKADPRRKHLPVIMISAHPEDKKVDLSLRKGVAFFLPKPIDFNRLLTLLKFAE